jgi:hypothetical protein
METPLAASRYWMFPSIAFLVTLLFLATNQRSGRLRYLVVLPAALMVWGFTADWKHPKFRDLDFPAHAAEFEAARPGDLVTIPINPNWEMRLKKR